MEWSSCIASTLIHSRINMATQMRVQNPVSGLYPQSSLLGSRDPSLPRRSMASSLGTQDLDPGQTRAA